MIGTVIAGAGVPSIIFLVVTLALSAGSTGELISIAATAVICVVVGVALVILGDGR